MPPQPPRQAAILGASGLVGSHLLRRLLEDGRYGLVRSMGRRSLPTVHPKLRQVLVDFEGLEGWIAEFQVDHLFCCLGTTFREAGSRAAFLRVDHDYPLGAARLAAQQGVAHFVWVSAAGANRLSPFLYPRTKGRLEAAVARLPLAAWTAVRPSLLLGQRHRPRWSEEVAKGLAPLITPALLGPLRRFRPIHADRVAASMVACAHGEPPEPGLQVIRGGAAR
jgi:uncharacterized protein YbjT (DUF2867 family)